MATYKHVFYRTARVIVYSDKPELPEGELSDWEDEILLDDSSMPDPMTVRLLTQDELTTMLPFGEEFTVAIDVDGEICQNYFQEKPLFHQDYIGEDPKPYADIVRWFGSVDSLFETVPAHIANLEEFYDYIEEN